MTDDKPLTYTRIMFQPVTITDEGKVPVWAVKLLRDIPRAKLYVILGLTPEHEHNLRVFNGDLVVKVRDDRGGEEVYSVNRETKTTLVKWRMKKRTV